MATRLLNVRWLPEGSWLSYDGDELMITMRDDTTMTFATAWAHLTRGQRWINFVGWRGAHGRQEIITSSLLTDERPLHGPPRFRVPFPD